MRDEALKSIRVHFEKALQLESICREKYLIELGSREPDKEARIRELLGALHEAEAEGFMATGNGASDSSQVPVRIGPYRVLKVLGRGGMGTVFLAEQQVPVQREVALKLVHGAFRSQRYWRRFESEARWLAFLDHRHITRFFDFGTTEEGDPYFAMEYVPGPPITEFCDKHRLSLDERLRIFSGLCEAVHHAHQKGIIHRDLKPGNVLVKLEQGIPVPKIIDFGIARARISLEDQDQVTGVTTIIGTPAYMSPEQLLGRRDIDTRSDIYSLGALLYKLLVGLTPLDEDKKLPLVHSAHKAHFKPIPCPSGRLTPGNPAHEQLARRRGCNAGTMRSRIRGDLDRICLKALDQDRSQRYATAHEFAGDIHRFLHDQPVLATAPSAWYRLGRFVRRHRLGVGAACMVGIALVLGFSMTALALFRARDAETKARFSAGQAIASANQAQAAFEVLRNILASPDPFISDKDIRVSELLYRFPEELPKNLVDQETEALLRHTIGRTYANLGLNSHALAQLEIAFELRSCQFGRSHPSTMETGLLVTQVLAEMGRLAEADLQSSELLALADTEYGESHPVTLEAMVNRVGISLECRQFEQALGLARDGLALCREILGEDHQQTIALYNYLGQIYLSLRDLALAEPNLAKALELNRRVHGEKHPGTLDILHNYLSLKLDMNLAGETAPQAEKLFLYQTETRGEDHPYTLGALSLWAHALLGTGDFNQSETLFRRLLDRGTHVFGKDHPRLAYCYQYLAKALYAQGNYQEAADYILRAMPIEAENFGKASPRMAVSHYNLGLALSEIVGQQTKAGNHFQKAEAIFTTLGNEPGLYFTLTALSKLSRKLENTAIAEEYLGKALDLDAKPKRGAFQPLSNMIVVGIPN